MKDKRLSSIFYPIHSQVQFFIKELANELELKLKNMREIKEKQDQRGTGKNLIDRNDSNNVVVLTRTDRAGNVRPHGEYSINRKKSGKRERRRKVGTLTYVSVLLPIIRLGVIFIKRCMKFQFFLGFNA